MILGPLASISPNINPNGAMGVICIEKLQVFFKAPLNFLIEVRSRICCKNEGKASVHNPPDPANLSWGPYQHRQNPIS